ncbi:hypothetical protein JOC86_001983 [Bacillus pakistanensis]|uniref:Uncharacterized protein n=1 Tax=Rossellomorea pakistanensis TaxID=992288 RepID=A0ABS2NC72_9BACI|nr:hypothetical protein [Bacillus pakistanensis]MBM7585441.1 hypothetical protein [Bacillus pakistanensis]
MQTETFKVEGSIKYNACSTMYNGEYQLSESDYIAEIQQWRNFLLKTK